MNLKLKEKKHIIRFFGLKPIKLKSYITDSEKLFILEQIQESYEERLKEKENIVPLIAGLEADIDILICTLSVQDIDFTNLKYSDLNNSGFLNFVKKYVSNYDEIRKSCFDMISLLKIESLIHNMSEFMNKFSDNATFLENLAEGKTSEEISALTEELKKINQEQIKKTTKSK